MNHYLAQANIAWMLGSIDEPVMSGLANRIDEINRLAEETKGFLWRLQNSEITHETLEPFDTDFPGFRRDRLFYTMSVWETLEDLRAYTFRTDHAEMLNNRAQWIDHFAGSYSALWWIPPDHRPTIGESSERLRSLRKLGPTAYAFTLRKAFPSPENVPS